MGDPRVGMGVESIAGAWVIIVEIAGGGRSQRFLQCWCVSGAIEVGDEIGVMKGTVGMEQVQLWQGVEEVSETEEFRAEFDVVWA